MRKKPLMKGLAGQNYKEKTNTSIKKIPYEQSKFFVDTTKRKTYEVNRINFNVPLRGDRVFNANIKADILDNESMISFGFKEYKWYWEMRKNVTPTDGIGDCLVVRIKKKDKDVDIYVYDNSHKKRYDYQGQLYANEFHEYANRVHLNVQHELMELVRVGIISGYKRNDYI